MWRVSSSVLQYEEKAHQANKTNDRDLSQTSMGVAFVEILVATDIPIGCADPEPFKFWFKSEVRSYFTSKLPQSTDAKEKFGPNVFDIYYFAYLVTTLRWCLKGFGRLFRHVNCSFVCYSQTYHSGIIACSSLTPPIEC
eukprot:2086708-Amphidinium_carterae.1